jgi:aspartate 1-decarboxylase
MLCTLLKAKLHHLRVTGVEPEYAGSLAIDEDWLDAAGIHPFEKILVANLANGERFETYAIPAHRGRREACLNGAAAYKGTIGDRLIVMAWCHLAPDEVARHSPRILCFNEANDLLR